MLYNYLATAYFKMRFYKQFFIFLRDLWIEFWKEIVIMHADPTGMGFCAVGSTLERFLYTLLGGLIT